MKKLVNNDKLIILFSFQYMEEVLRCNEFMEFFIEGGRTRSGKATHPKSGLLSVIVDAFNAGRRLFSFSCLFPINLLGRDSSLQI